MASVAFVPAPAEGLNHPNVLGMFAARAKRTPDLPALRFKRHGIWRALTWRDWQRAGEALAAGFIARLGVQRGTRIALMAPTRVEWALCDLGIAMAGAVSVPIYPSATPEQAAHIVRDSGAEIAIVADAPQARRLRAAATGLQHVLVLDDPGPTDIGLDLLQAEGEGQLARLRPVLTAIAAELGHADPFTFVYTSGTTGVPKGVVLSHKNFVYEAWAIKNVVAADRSDEQLMVLPLAHVFARHLLWGAVEQGAVTAFAPAASTAALTTAFQEVAPTYMCAVPRVYDRFYNQILAEVQAGGVVVRAAFERCMEVGRKVSMCRQRGQSLPGALALKMNLADRLFFNKIKQQFGGRLRFFVSGGAPLRREVAEFFHAIGVLILEGYGLTETTGATHVNRPDRFRFGTVGPAMPGCELRIAEDGEILIRGPGVMQGYHGLPEDTAAALDEAGWLHTGDIGELRDGFLRDHRPQEGHHHHLERQEHRPLAARGPARAGRGHRPRAGDRRRAAAPGRPDRPRRAGHAGGRAPGGPRLPHRRRARPAPADPPARADPDRPSERRSGQLRGDPPVCDRALRAQRGERRADADAQAAPP